MKAKKSVILYGLRRSGNHLIRNWLTLIHPSPASFFSNVQLEFFHRVEELVIDGLTDYHFIVISIEEQPPASISIAHSDSIGETRKVMILRDPYNLFASRIKHYNMLCYQTFNADFIRYLWVDYAKYYLSQPRGVQFILFNKFVSDAEYRKKLCKDFNQQFIDTVDNYVINSVDTRNSKGSSFDGTDYEGRASEMKVNDRWQFYKDYEVYKMLFNDEIRHLSKEIFDFTPL